MSRSIENEEQYQNSLAWLVEKAQALEHPLMDGEVKAKLDKQYDFVSEKVREYNLNRPEMKQLYKEAGMLQEEIPETITEPVVENKSINLASWLEDD